MILKYRYIAFLFLHLFAISLFAQKAERDYIRKGNRSFNDSVFVDAEVNYRKALDANPKSPVAMYNLGNTLSQEKKFKEAIEQYTTAAKLEKDKGKLAKIYHNAGVLFQASKNYQQAVDAYKMSLRNNPKDNETRYNLALALSMLKQQQQQQQKDKNKDNKQDQKDKDKDKKDQDKKSKDQKKDQKDKQENSKPQKQDNKMSKENAQQLLNSVMQDEKNIQDKVKKQQVMQGGRLEKDW